MRFETAVKKKYFSDLDLSGWWMGLDGIYLFLWKSFRKSSPLKLQLEPGFLSTWKDMTSRNRDLLASFLSSGSSLLRQQDGCLGLAKSPPFWCRYYQFTYVYIYIYIYIHRNSRCPWSVFNMNVYKWCNTLTFWIGKKNFGFTKVCPVVKSLACWSRWKRWCCMRFHVFFGFPFPDDFRELHQLIYANAITSKECLSCLSHGCPHSFGSFLSLSKIFIEGYRKWMWEEGGMIMIIRFPYIESPSIDQILQGALLWCTPKSAFDKSFTIQTIQPQLQRMICTDYIWTSIVFFGCFFFSDVFLGQTPQTFSSMTPGRTWEAT